MPGGRRTFHPESWAGSALAAAIVLALAVLTLALIPDWLVARALAGSSLVRDMVVILWTTGIFVSLAWLVVRLQPEGRR